MTAKNGAPLPEPKPWIRKSEDIMRQAHDMMGVTWYEESEPPEDDPE